MPFGSTGSFQLRKILSSKGVPFTDLAGIGPGTTNKINFLKPGNSRDRKIKEMTEHPIKNKSEHRSIFINIHSHAKGSGREYEKALQSGFCHLQCRGSMKLKCYPSIRFSKLHAKSNCLVV